MTPLPSFIFQDGENLYIFWTIWGIPMKYSGKMELMIVSKKKKKKTVLHPLSRNLMVKQSFVEVGCVAWCFANNCCSFVINPLNIYFQFSGIAIQLDPVCFAFKIFSCFNKGIFVYWVAQKFRNFCSLRNIYTSVFHI